MEDVQQRRERLAAMREQAAVEDNSDASAARTVPAGSLSLPSPVMETPPGTAVGTSRASGFDFYTDPLTAFTSAKRRKPVIGGVGGALPFRGVVRTPLLQPAPEPLPVFYHTPLDPAPPPLPPGDHGWQPIPYQPPFGAPDLPSAYSWGQPLNTSNFARGGGMEMGFVGRGRGTYAPTEGRGGYVNDSSSQYRGYGSSNNRWSSGRGGSNASGYSGRGGTGRGPQGRGGQRGGRTPSAKDRPHLYYKKSMVEDPWKALEERLQRN